MSNISCIEFERLVELAVESRTPVDSAVLRGHAAECAGCRVAWLDAMLLDGAVAEWRRGNLAVRRPGRHRPDTPDERPRTRRLHRSHSICNAILYKPRCRHRHGCSMISPSAVSRMRPRSPTDSGSLGALPRQRSWWPSRYRFRCIGIEPGGRMRLRSPIIGQGSSSLMLELFSHDFGTASSVTGMVAARPRLTRFRSVERPSKRWSRAQQAAYLDLANEAAHAVAGATALVPRSSLASVMSPSRDENGRWVDDVGHQFEPVGKNLSQAFQFIFEAVPADKAPAT